MPTPAVVGPSPGLVKPRDWIRASIPLALGLFLGLGGLLVIYEFARAFAVLVLSVTLAESLAPVAAWLSRRMRRVFAVLLIYLALFAVLALLAYFVVPEVTGEGAQLLHRAPEFLGALGDRVHRWTAGFPDVLIPDPGRILSTLMSTLAALPMKFATSGLTLVLTVFLSIYWLLAMPTIDAFVLSLFPEHRRARAARIRAEIGRAMGGYFRGVALNALAVGALVGTSLALAGVHYALALGMLSALGEFFPYIGPILAAVPGVLTALMQSPSKALWTALIYLAVEQIEGHVLTPNIMRTQTDIPQSLVIIALFAGGAAGGLLGAIVAIPIAGACKVLTEEIIAPAIREWLRESAVPLDTPPAPPAR